MINCLATTLKANIFSFRGTKSNDIFRPNETTEINLSCTSEDSKFKINLNVTVEKNLNPPPPPIKTFEEFIQNKSQTKSV